jgi:hypothetical protein
MRCGMHVRGTFIRELHQRLLQTRLLQHIQYGVVLPGTFKSFEAGYISMFDAKLDCSFKLRNGQSHLLFSTQRG